MKKALLLMMAAMTASTGVAGAAVASQETAKRETAVYTIGADGSKTYWQAGKDGRCGMVKGETVSPAKVRKNAGPRRIATMGEPKPLEIEIRYDENLYDVDRIGAGLHDATEFDLTDLAPQKNLGLCQVPYGVSSLFACLVPKQINQETGLQDIYFIAKDISTLPAGSKVVLDVADCVHRIRYESLNRDGSPVKVSTWTQDDRLVEQGDYNESFGFYYWSHKNDHNLWFALFKETNIKLADGTVFRPSLGDVWMNDCGPDFALGYAKIYSPVEGRDCTIVEMPVWQGTDSREPSEVLLRNSPACYRDYDQRFSRSPYFTATASDLVFGTQLMMEDHGVTVCGIGNDISYMCEDRDIDIRLTVCHNDPDDPASSLLRILAKDMCPENEGGSTFGISSMYWRPTDNGREYLPMNHCGEQGIAIPYETYLNFVEGNYSDWLLCYGKPNPFLAIDDSKVEGRLGNCCPILSVRHENIPELASDFAWTFLGLTGRYGEGNVSATELVEYEKNMGNYDSDNMRWEKYTYDNVLVDGEVEGSLQVRIGVRKGTSADDYIAPVLTNLGMRNTSGILTDRFAKPEEGVIEIYAADFDLDNNWSLGEWFLTYQFYELPEEGVKVEYAPYGSSDFVPLEVTRVPEKRFLPGWGDFYTCPTAAVDRKSGNGWFDLRVTLTDARGNTQEQVVSPAFRIGSAVGAVEGITDSADGGPAVYYDLAGRSVSSLEKGVYIVRDSNGTRKVMK